MSQTAAPPLPTSLAALSHHNFFHFARHGRLSHLHSLIESRTSARAPVPNSDLESTLDVAALAGHPAVVWYLLDVHRLAPKPSTTQGALVPKPWATQQALLEILLDCGMEIHGEEGSLSPLLHPFAEPMERGQGRGRRAVVFPVLNRELLAWLLDNGLEVNAASAEGMTLLSTVVKHVGRAMSAGPERTSACIRLIDFLVSRGAELGQSNTLHVAARLGDKDIAARLLERGADVNRLMLTHMPLPILMPSMQPAQTLDRATPLAEAAMALARGSWNGSAREKAERRGECVSTDMLEFLLGRGADPTVRGGSGLTAAECAQKVGGGRADWVRTWLEDREAEWRGAGRESAGNRSVRDGVEALGLEDRRG